MLSPDTATAVRSTEVFTEAARRLPEISRTLVGGAIAVTLAPSFRRQPARVKANGNDQGGRGCNT